MNPCKNINLRSWWKARAQEGGQDYNGVTISSFEKAKRNAKDQNRWRFVTGNVNRHAAWYLQGGEPIDIADHELQFFSVWLEASDEKECRARLLSSLLYVIQKEIPQTV